MIKQSAAFAAAAVAMASSIAIAPPAKAATYSADCPTLIAQTEARRNIPRGLLMAIAVTESALNGRPNPYAMNIAGRAYHASGTQEMASIIQSNWSRGVRSIDVGCMQINLKFHGQKFARLTDLLDSPTNVEYGASYLISLAADEGSWKQAVMSYHNKNNPARRQWYGCKVWNNYLRLAGAQSGFIAWTGHSSCSVATKATASTGQILQSIMNAPIIRCDQSQWDLAGLTLADFNAGLSSATAILIAIFLIRALRPTRSQ